MTFKDCVAQIIKLFGASLTAIPLPMRVAIVKPTFADLIRPTFRAADAIGPTQLANFGIAFCLIDQVLNIEHRALLSLFGSLQLIAPLLLSQISSLKPNLSL